MQLLKSHLVRNSEPEASFDVRSKGLEQNERVSSFSIMKKGAEADIYKTNGTVIKERIPKRYRIKELDGRLRKIRTRAEAKLLRRAAGIISVPQVLAQGVFSIEMEFIGGPRVKDILCKKNLREICAQISESAAKLHNAEIIHGDMTTSNMILRVGASSKAENERQRSDRIFFRGKVYFIDFGLGFFSKSPEDMAVDLHVLFEAFASTHSEIADEACALVLSGYEKAGGKREVLLRLKKLEMRGRYVKRK